MKTVELLLIMFAVTWLLWIGQSKVLQRSDGTIKKKKCSKFGRLCINIILLLIFIKFFAFREIDEMVGGMDAYAYSKRFYNATGGLKQGLFSQGNELGYALLVFIVRCFTDDFKVFLVVYYSILLILINNINRDIVKNYFSFIMTFLFITFNIVISMCLMRNQLSCFLAFNSILYYIKNKKAKSGIFFILAVSCHYSAMIVLVGYALTVIYKKWHFNPIKFCLFLGFFVLVLLIGGRYVFNIIANSRYGSYLSNSGKIGYGQMMRIIAIFLVLLLTYKRGKINYSTRKHIMQVADLFLIFPMQKYLSILYRTFVMADYSKMVLLNGVYCENIKRKKSSILLVFNFGATALLLLELYLFFTQTALSYGLLIGV